MNSVRISRRAAQRFAGGHPWIFSSDITDRGAAQPGESVLVLDHSAKPLGVAHYSSTSQITLRFLHNKPVPVDADFYRHRIAAAFHLRQQIVHRSNAYRLVHSEADLLPGLIVDSYAGHLSVQFLTQGMDRDTPAIVEALNATLQPISITARNDSATRRLENLPSEKKTLIGELPDLVPIQMNGLTFYADIFGGQKTGVFLDQRENYQAAARLAEAFHPKLALDCFTSTGGFALRLAGHAETVEAIDASPAALGTAQRNAAANSIRNVSFKEADAFDALARFSTSRRRFDLIVLDPPAFAKSKQNVRAALRGYREINQRALQLLSPGGILITCSCSHHVSEADLLGVVAEASLAANRTVRVLERRTQSSDHPILLTVPETLYLKCLLLQVL
ncbi:MAG: class I SAM-dependent rRNA methyltransferase [Bryobacterales bacterium]|nr:class I SAM-dependent rRNA methyltransferase [Bryobacterales bacterium]